MTRIPDCQCSGHPNVSPLLQIRWKRIVIDEGHVSAFASTNLDHFAQMLSVERRWIVTGTPTTNLLGLGLGKNTETKKPDDVDQGYTLQAESPDDPNSVAHIRRWTSYDREDLHKLGVMMTRFLGVPRFATDSKYFATHVTAALFGPQGPHPGAIRVLNQVMEMIMIRHRCVCLSFEQ